MSGLKKLMIIAHKSADSSQEVKKYSVLVNPDSIKADYQISYSQSQAPGTTTPQLKYQHTPSGTIRFKLIFDGTGLISTVTGAQKSQTVDQQIEDFKATTLQYEGSIHRPYFLTLVWGKALFRGVLTELSINYKLFKPDGTPLRAEADVTFQTSDNAKAAEEKADRQSSDLTHSRQIKAGDRLPNICNSIYEGTNYYVQVAKHNQLNHLRTLKPGTQLSFPPLVN
ncbi:MAG: LysM peptidoglycan-binding domain-containing protein [Bacteroidota bacterium]